MAPKWFDHWTTWAGLDVKEYPTSAIGLLVCDTSTTHQEDYCSTVIVIRSPFLLHCRPAVIVSRIRITRFCRVRQFKKLLSLRMYVFQLLTRVLITIIIIIILLLLGRIAVLRT